MRGYRRERAVRTTSDTRLTTEPPLRPAVARGCPPRHHCGSGYIARYPGRTSSSSGTPTRNIALQSCRCNDLDRDAVFLAYTYIIYRVIRRPRSTPFQMMHLYLASDLYWKIRECHRATFAYEIFCVQVYNIIIFLNDYIGVFFFTLRRYAKSFFAQTNFLF